MQQSVIALLKELRAYALEKSLRAAIYYHEEDSYLMRFANSAISLNTNEHLVRLQISVYDGNKHADYEMIADPNQIEPLKRGIDTAAEMASRAQALSYTPSIPCYRETVIDMQAYDPFLAGITNPNGWSFSTRSPAVWKPKRLNSPASFRTAPPSPPKSARKANTPNTLLAPTRPLPRCFPIRN